ncbi:vasodilator-stimulated phosphoprotein-like [Schistocerca nitens]|uniref:vasodilator-stimulated phosphoprotein-like n=1 Tax=Schistocerca nitens TaxID=7011 RepID=UPI0021192774|nr:vasodilator-stimulated phosphoprotein-like [Schistocerca nitens]
MTSSTSDIANSTRIRRGSRESELYSGVGFNSRPTDGPPPRPFSAAPDWVPPSTSPPPPPPPRQPPPPSSAADRLLTVAGRDGAAPLRPPPELRCAQDLRVGGKDYLAGPVSTRSGSEPGALSAPNCRLIRLSPRAYAALTARARGRRDLGVVPPATQPTCAAC